MDHLGDADELVEILLALGVVEVEDQLGLDHVHVEAVEVAQEVELFIFWVVAIQDLEADVVMTERSDQREKCSLSKKTRTLVDLEIYETSLQVHEY